MPYLAVPKPGTYEAMSFMDYPTIECFNSVVKVLLEGIKTSEGRLSSEDHWEWLYDVNQETFEYVADVFHVRERDWPLGGEYDIDWLYIGECEEEDA